MAHHLMEAGHSVDVFTLQKGSFADSFQCRVLASPDGRYDLGLVNHNTCMPLARPACDYTIFTSHGIYPDLEQPVLGADSYVAVSEEVAAHLSACGYSSTVIRNAIDTREFASGSLISQSLSRVLSMCQGTGAAYQVSRACIHLGIEYRIGGLGISRADDVLADIHWADCVVGLGRTALEAMSAGRAVLVLDSRAYMDPAMDGIVIRESVQAFEACNFSGRAMGIRPTVEGIISELRCYSADMGSFNRDLVQRRFNLEIAWKQYEHLVDLQCGPME
ncbi:MAG: glycosyltransferase family protein [Coriobacteriia bacterium]